MSLTSASYASIVSVLLTLLFCSSVLFAQNDGVPSECTQVLLQRNVSLLNTNDYRSAIYLNSIDRNSFNQIKKEFGINVPDAFSGDWDSFEERRNTISERTQFSETTERSLSALTIVSLPDATDAWLECVRIKSESGAFFGTISGNFKGTNFSLTVTWKPPYIQAQQPIKVTRSSVPGIKRGERIPDGTTTIDISRQSTDEELRYSVTGKIGGITRSFIVFIPAYVAVPNLKPIPSNLTLTVDGKDNSSANAWLDTNIDLEKGQKVKFAASGTVDIGAGRRDDAEGTTDGRFLYTCNPDPRCGALIGRIVSNGQEGAAFKIGVSRDYVAQASGRLFLAVSDIDHSNNGGGFQVKIIFR